MAAQNIATAQEAQFNAWLEQQMSRLSAESGGNTATAVQDISKYMAGDALPGQVKAINETAQSLGKTLGLSDPTAIAFGSKLESVTSEAFSFGGGGNPSSGAGGAWGVERSGFKVAFESHAGLGWRRISIFW